MNNLDNLFPCLGSIESHTKVSYEIIVVAYLFSNDNLQKLKDKFTQVRIIESNEIRGFSENNNLGIEVAKGEFCFILNDDTFFKDSVADNLIRTFEEHPDATIVSPDIRYPDGRYQICGRRRYDWKYWIIASFELEDYFYKQTPYENQEGVFQTYNISGAAFVIRTDVFKKLGMFDEIYFFSPEDIALSTLINRNGQKCYVDANVKVYHIASASSSKIQSATMPAHTIGSLIFFSDGSKVLRFLLACVVFLVRGMKMLHAKFLSMFSSNPKYKILVRANFNTCSILFSNKKPREVFIKFYSNLRSV